MDLLKLLEGIRTPFLDTLFSLVTHLGEEIIVVAILCIIFWCIDKKLAYKIGVGYAIGAILMNGIKITVKIPRPWELDPSFKAVESAVPGASGYSFPSGHTQCAATVYGIGAVKAKNVWLRLVCIFLILVVSFSRLYLGVHTPADVIGAFVLSALVIVFALLCIKADEDSFKKALPMTLLLLGLSIAVMIYAYIVNTKGIVDDKNALDCFKIAGLGIGMAIGYAVEHSCVQFCEKTEKLWMQIVKVAVGMGVLVGLKVGGKALLGATPVAYLINNSLLAFWMMAGWPMIFKKLFKTAE